MTQITPHLAVFQGPTGVQLHLTDAYGHVNGVVLLSEDECRALSQVLVSVKPIVVVDVQAETVESEPEPEPEPEVTEEEAPEALEGAYVDTDWASMTKAEIVTAVQVRYGQELDASDRKDVLIAQAVELEATHDA